MTLAFAGRGNACRVLASMLQDSERVIQGRGHFRLAEDSDDSAHGSGYREDEGFGLVPGASGCAGLACGAGTFGKSAAAGSR